MKKVIIGIDISKLTIDVCIQEEGSFGFHCIDNNPKTLRKFFKQFKNQEVLISMENTGRYNYFLYEVLPEFFFCTYVVNPLHIKKSMGLVRGKNDKIDSKRIAQFIEKNHTELKEWEPVP